jgi:hypothetical protein
LLVWFADICGSEAFDALKSIKSSEETRGNKMRRTLLVVTLLLATSSMGWGGTCTGGLMSAYLTSGFSCTIDDKLFSNFSYSNVGTAPDASVVMVTPQTGTEEGFQFQGAWAAGPTQSGDSLIGFTVSIASGTNLITDAVLSMSGVATSGGGTASVAENLSNGASLFVFSGGGLSQLADSATFAGVSTLDVHYKDVEVAGNGGFAAISAVVNAFSQDGGHSGSTVPEPGSMMLLGSGLLTLAGYVRRGRRKSST